MRYAGTHPFVPARRQGRLRRAAGKRQRLQGWAVGAVSWKAPPSPPLGAHAHAPDAVSSIFERFIANVELSQSMMARRPTKYAASIMPARKARVSGCEGGQPNRAKPTMHRNARKGGSDTHLLPRRSYCPICQQKWLHLYGPLHALSPWMPRRCVVSSGPTAARLLPRALASPPPRAPQVRYARHGHPSSVLKCVVVVVGVTW